MELTFVIQPVVYQHKLWQLLFLFFKVSSAMLNIWLVTHKRHLYPYNYYVDSNVIRLTRSANKVEYYTIQNCLEFHQYADHNRIINIWRLVSDIFHTMVGVSISWKEHIHQLYHLNPLMDKLNACTRLSRQLRTSGDTQNSYHSTLVHQ